MKNRKRTSPKVKEQHAAVAAILLQMTGTSVGIGIGQNKCDKINTLDCYLDLAHGFIDCYV